MKRSFAFVLLLTAVVTAALQSRPVRAQGAYPLAGVWTLNRAQSEFPADIGFNPEWMKGATADGQSGGSSGGSSRGGRGGRGSSSGSSGGNAASPFSSRQQSSEDARRLQLVTADVRSPASRLTIVDGPLAVTFTNELGQSRTIHPDGKQESIEIEGVSFAITSRRDGQQLVIVYRVDVNREIRYTYSTTTDPAQLVVDVQLLEHGNGDKARRVYDSGLTTTETSKPAGGGASSAQAPASSAGGAAPPETFDQRPGAELKGLTSLGVLVESLSSQATACGLNQDAIEGALAKRLTAGGLNVRRNSDEDTYVYVNIQTNMSNGVCWSRYDAFLYTHATSKLSYHDQPVLVQVSLMHRGGIGGSVPTGHGAAITRGLEDYVGLFVTQIHDANK